MVLHHSLEETSTWFAIVNPLAGSGRGLDDFPLISKLLRDNGIACEAVFTEHKSHAVELTVEAVRRGFRKIIAIGGDGTLHDVVNGLFIQTVVAPDQILLSMISVGSGNDWIRTFGMPQQYAAAIRAIRDEKSFLQDVGRVTYEESMYRQTRYMTNVGGVGMDANVIRECTHLKIKRKKTTKLMYHLTTIRQFFRYKSTGVKIWVDDRLIYNNLLLSIAVGVGRFNGGGIQQLPEAVTDDGLFDITLYRPIHFWHILFRFNKLFNGEIYSIGHINKSRGEKIRIESSPEANLELDGEILGHTPVEFEIVHRAIRVIVSEEFLKSNGCK